MIDSICQTIVIKETIEEVYLDLTAIRLLCQTKSGVPPSEIKQLKQCLNILSGRFKDEFKEQEGKWIRYRIWTKPYLIQILFVDEIELTPPPTKKRRCSEETQNINKDAEQPSTNTAEITPTENPQVPDVNQPTTSADSKPIEKPAETAPAKEDDKADVEMIDCEAVRSSESASVGSSAQPKITENPPEPPPVPSTSKCEELSSEKEYERMLLKRIYKNLVSIWEAIEKYEAETSVNNTSGTSTNSATSQSTSMERCNEVLVEVVIANSTDTAPSEQTTQEQQQT